MINGNYKLLYNAEWQNVQQQEVFLECDTTLGPVNIDLFDILSTKRNWGVKIIISDATNNASVNNITINTSGTDVIDQDGNNQVILATNGESLVLQITGDNLWLATESIGGGAGATEYKQATLPTLSVNTSSIPKPELVGDFFDNPGIYIYAGQPAIKLNNGNVALVYYCQTVLKDGTYIYEVYDTVTANPINGYWVAFRQDALNPNLLNKVAELQMTTQFWNNWYDYTVKNGADNEVQLVVITTANSDGTTLEGWITTLSYANGVLTAVDSNPNFGETVLSLYNSLTGFGLAPGTAMWNYWTPEYNLDDDYYGMALGSDFGWVYYQNGNGLTPTETLTYVGFNIFTNETRVLDTLSELVNLTNYDYNSYPTIEKNIKSGNWVHPNGFLFVLCDNNSLNNGNNNNGVTALWSPYWTDNTRVIYLNDRVLSSSSPSAPGTYIYTGGNWFGGSNYNWYWDKENIYTFQGSLMNVYWSGGQNMIVTRFNMNTKEVVSYNLPNLDGDFQSMLSFSSWANDNSMMFYVNLGLSNQIFGLYNYYVLSNNGVLRLQSNNNYPTNMLGNKSYSTRTGMLLNPYCVGVQFDEYKDVQF